MVRVSFTYDREETETETGREGEGGEKKKKSWVFVRASFSWKQPIDQRTVGSRFKSCRP